MQTLRFLLLCFVMGMVFSAPSALASCVSGGEIRIIGQLPDFVFVAGGPQTNCSTSQTGKVKLPWASIVTSRGGCGVWMHSESTNIGISIRSQPLAFGTLTTSDEIMWNGVPWYPAVTDSLPFCLAKSSSAAPSSGVVELWDKWQEIVNIPSTDAKLMGKLNWYVMRRSGEYPLAFLHSATRNNSFNNYTLIDNGFTNNNPSAKILVTPRLTPLSKKSLIKNKHYNIGVFYSIPHKKWAIFYQDKHPMEIGAEFNVRLEGNRGERVVADQSHIKNERLYLDIPAANNNPYAAIYITASSNTKSSPSPRSPVLHNLVYNDHPVGVGYDPSNERWYIANEDGARMPIGATFNIKVVHLPDVEEAQYKKTGTAVVSSNISGSAMIINNPQFNNSNQIIFVTHRISSPKRKGIFLNPHPVGISYENSHWVVVNLDGSIMPINSIFNIFAATPPLTGQ